MFAAEKLRKSDWRLADDHKTLIRLSKTIWANAAFGECCLVEYKLSEICSPRRVVCDIDRVSSTDDRF
ncbi:hypothetical protein L596_030576 [Steinernema carpocapsae]|uniref:Uncharacterized protein n=1 Tax=Steinernema carpocapsae TaxID=34508 RepID=A0A4U5LPU7_STECR|nr:hypothetical protein L596_030576 [Steinernema carpocapsae]